MENLFFKWIQSIKMINKLIYKLETSFVMIEKMWNLQNSFRTY